MKSYFSILGLSALLGAVASPLISRAVGPNLVLWDSSSPLSDSSSLESRTGWKFVPSDLLTLEADPPKASSDPGFYGRGYSFAGDAIVESRWMSAIFCSDQGSVLLYAKNHMPGDGNDLRQGAQLGIRVAELRPLGVQNPKIDHVEIIRNADDEVVLQVSFAPQGSTAGSCLFSFGRSEIVTVKPSAALSGVSIKSALRYAVAPSFVGDDLIFNSGADTPDKSLFIPAESLLLGLVEGEASELVLTWPQGKQSVQLRLGEERDGVRGIEAIDFHNDGRSLYLATLAAPGIWHREPLDPSFLEKDVSLKWKPPFTARWTTQLYEEGVRTSFAFRPVKGQVWRGVPGSYNYPVWFEGGEAYFHLSKKVAPQGDALIYCLEARDTPAAVSTPADILSATLGREAAEPILDVAGRKLRTHHRRGGEGVRRACTCGCTEAIEAVFEAGEEVSRKDYIAGALDDMIYFVHQHVDRINEYRAFAADLTKLLEEKARTDAQLKPFIESLQQIVSQIPQECEVQKDNMKSFEYADELSRKTIALTSRSDTNNVKAYMGLLKAWRDMGGAQDYVLARCHMITRSLCQEAGYGCVHQPEAVAFAQEVRKRCKQCLRHPDGYEIWADY